MNTSHAQLKKALLSINFSEKEAKVYLALLELGKGKVSQIARKAGINRTTGYVILDALVSKGLVIVSGKEPTEEYAAESPDKIKQYIQSQIEKNQEYLKNADNFVPQLKTMQNVRGRPKVRFYEGKQGLQEVYEDTLTSREEIKAFASVEDTQNTLPRYFPAYYKRRAAKRIPIRAIFPNTPQAQELTKHNAEELRRTLLVPAEVFNFSPEINIYNNKIMIASWKEKLGITIESAEISDAMKKIFELAWIGAKYVGLHKEKLAD